MSNYFISDESPTWEYLKPFYDWNQTYFPVTHICKYYEENENRIAGVWDILETIDSEMDDVERYIDEYRNKALLHDTEYRLRETNLSPKQLKKALDYLEDLRDEVVDGQDLFYTWVNPYHYRGIVHNESEVFSSFRHAATPVKKIKMDKLYRPQYEPHAGTWMAVEVDTDEPKNGVLIEDRPIYNCVTINGRRRVAPFAIDGFALYGADNIVAETPKDALASLNLEHTLWATCKGCGKLFYYYKTDKNTPKWCRTCHYKLRR